VTTIVQQIDSQGPAVVERITTQFADVACSPENARMIVDALRNGTAVTLTSNVNGETKTATFTPTGSNLGYGEAYITMALAAEALRSAGVSGCATPDQWKAVLLGGPLAAADSTSTRTTSVASASSSSHFPGILALRSQGQGWGQIAQATNVQLGQVMSSARSSLNIESSADSALSPTGRSSAEMQRSRSTTPGASSSSSTDRAMKDHPGKAKGHDKQPQNTNQDRSSDDDTSSSSPGRSGDTPNPNR
jgi:hypothetical protein